MADEEAVPGAEGPLVAVTFQKTPHKKQKYLESEPKALGVTQIALSVFYISSLIVILSNIMSVVVEDLTQVIGSVFVIIAGSLAIAAQNLHLPTLKACLGMQVVACGASVFNLIVSVSDMVGHRYGYGCWKYVEITSTDHNDSCYSITASTGHYFAELVLINTALIAISVTLAAYCCKVVNCCSPGQQMNYHDLAYDGNAKRKKISPCSPCLPRTDITLKCKVWLEAYQYYACGVSRMG